MFRQRPELFENKRFLLAERSGINRLPASSENEMNIYSHRLQSGQVA